MDRRQKRTREAIFHAFTALLSEKDFERITVGEIIQRADIGRATFYSHFETKDFLLKALCEELFSHIFHGIYTGNSRIFDCDAPDSVFLHLLQHLHRNDNGILTLLSCRNNDLFLRYFKTGLEQLVITQLPDFLPRKNPALPEDFWVHHIASTFVETVRWWIDHKMQQSPETIAEYFYLSV